MDQVWDIARRQLNAMHRRTDRLLDLTRNIEKKNDETSNQVLCELGDALLQDGQLRGHALLRSFQLNPNKCLPIGDI